jgi:hypothetical protein
VKPNTVKDRFLAELDHWLTDGLLYYAFTGEPVNWTVAHDDYQRQLLFHAAKNWPDRLRRIEKGRLAK